MLVVGADGLGAAAADRLHSAPWTGLRVAGVFGEAPERLEGLQRHKVKPGITGWPQLNGYRGETDTLEKMQKRVEFDLYYIENWSVWFDLRILVMTAFKGFVNRNAY